MTTLRHGALVVIFLSKSSKVKITGVDNVVDVGCSLCGVTARVVNRVLFYCIVLIMQSVPLRVLTLSLPMTYSVDKSHLSIIDTLIYYT